MALITLLWQKIPVSAARRWSRDWSCGGDHWTTFSLRRTALTCRRGRKVHGQRVRLTHPLLVLLKKHEPIKTNKPFTNTRASIPRTVFTSTYFSFSSLLFQVAVWFVFGDCCRKEENKIGDVISFYTHTHVYMENTIWHIKISVLIKR